MNNAGNRSTHGGCRLPAGSLNCSHAAVGDGIAFEIHHHDGNARQIFPHHGRDVMRLFDELRDFLHRTRGLEVAVHDRPIVGGAGRDPHSVTHSGRTRKPVDHPDGVAGGDLRVTDDLDRDGRLALGLAVNHREFCKPLDHDREQLAEKCPKKFYDTHRCTSVSHPVARIVGDLSYDFVVQKSIITTLIDLS